MLLHGDRFMNDSSQQIKGSHNFIIFYKMHWQEHQVGGLQQSWVTPATSLRCYLKTCLALRLVKAKGLLIYSKRSQLLVTKMLGQTQQGKQEMSVWEVKGSPKINGSAPAVFQPLHGR